MNIDELALGQIKRIQALIGNSQPQLHTLSATHPMIGRRCLIRTYSAGVHIGTVLDVQGMECHLKDSLRLWKWEGGGLSLSAVANNGILSGRLNRTGEVYLTNVIEIIPTTPVAEKTFTKFIEDEK
tara:strand:- start:66 stop:443 length:378 start_codon:yes stop_codon:yes gene_type:complete